MPKKNNFLIVGVLFLFNGCVYNADKNKSNQSNSIADSQQEDLNATDSNKDIITDTGKAVDKACTGISCGAHGSCQVVGDDPFCVCDPGFEPAGLDCHAVAEWLSKQLFTNQAGEHLLTPSYLGNVEIEYDVTPLNNQSEGLVAYTALDQQLVDYTSFSVLIRMNLNGQFDVRNGSDYTNDLTVTYEANQTYHFRVAINLPAKTYSVWVSSLNASERQLAKDYAFRSDADSTINNIGKVFLISEAGDDLFTVNNHTIKGTATGQPNCAQGMITKPCVCAGQVQQSGHCCGGQHSASACPDPDGDGGDTGDTGETGDTSLDSGWTTITPSTDTLTIYVSSSSGRDSNDGQSPDSPVATIAHAAGLVRSGYPDHILLRRGDVWTDERLGRFHSGRSASEPMVISYYGSSGPRPLIELSGSFIDHAGGEESYFALIGLHLVDYRMDPNDPRYNGQGHGLVRLVGGGRDILIEDCRLRFVEIIVQSYGGQVYRNFRLRRSIVLDVWGPNTSNANSPRPSGIFASGVDGLIIEENVFDHNGWSEDVPGAGANMYNHNMYIQYSCVGNQVVVRGNIVTRASSHGVHGRPGGLYENNLFVRNSISLQMGYNGHPMSNGTFARAHNNVILHGKAMDPNDSSWPRTAAIWGLELADLGGASVEVVGNIVANRDDDEVNTGIRDFNGVSYTNNVQHNWGGGIGDMPDPGWVDPKRDLSSYQASLGKTPTRAAFLEVVRNRPLRQWPLEYTAAAVNDYIRAGFVHP